MYWNKSFVKVIVTVRYQDKSFGFFVPGGLRNLISLSVLKDIMDLTYLLKKWKCNYLRLSSYLPNVTKILPCHPYLGFMLLCKSKITLKHL